LLQPTFQNYAVAVHWYNQGSFTGMSTEDAFALWFDLTTSWDAPIFVGEFGVEPKPPAYGEEPVRPSPVSEVQLPVSEVQLPGQREGESR
jgi:hypothetical protein